MKKEINKTLGNSLRCILPSFWWKRLLGKMADRIESAENSASSAMTMATLAGREASDKQPQLVSGSNIKTINNQSILGSGNITVSTERMEKYKTKEELDAVGSTDGGEIAAVVDDVLIEKSFTECYQPTRSEIEANPYNKKFTKVDGLALNPDFSPNLISSNYGTLSVRLFSDGNSKGYHKEYPSHMEIRCGFDREIFCWEYDSASGLGHRLYDSSGFHASNIDRVNNILREGNFRFSYFEVTYREDVNAIGYTYYYSYNANFPSDATAMIDNVVKMLFADTQNADIYVRSAEWVKLLKEGDVTGGSGAETQSVELLYLRLQNPDSAKEHNAKVYEKMNKEFVRLLFNDASRNNNEIFCATYGCSYVKLEDYFLVYVKDAPNGRVFRLTSDGTLTFEFRDTYADSSLSDTSTNAVQNKVVKAYVDEQIAAIGEGVEFREFYISSDSFANVEGELTEQQKAYNIETVELVKRGKAVVLFGPSGTKLYCCAFGSGAEAGSSSFTFQYAHFYLYSLIVDKDGNVTLEVNYKMWLDSELSETSGNAIQNKVVTSALNSKADNTRVDLISERLDDIVSEMGDFATESQLNNKQDVITDLDTIRQGAAKGATALQSVPSEYVTETELSSKNFATVSQVNAKQDTISDLATIRSNAAKGATAIQQVKTINGEAIDGEGNIDVLTKDLYDNILEEMLVNEEVYAAGVNDLNSRLLETNDALNSEVASREELSEEVQALTDRVTSNEEVTATSYNELNSRIESNYQHGEEAYATKTELADEVSTINAAIVDNEEVIAATLNDLLSRIESLTTRIEQLENA